MAEWGTPIRMLGNVGRSAAGGLGATYDALPAGSVSGGFTLGALPPGMGPQPWASYPGSGGPNQTVEAPYPDPEFRRNVITMPIISPDDPQNRQRAFNGGFMSGASAASSALAWDPRAGMAIRGYDVAGLGAGLGLAGGLVTPWQGNKTSFTMGVGRSLGKLGQLARPWKLGRLRALGGGLGLGAGSSSDTVTYVVGAEAGLYHLLGAVVGGAHGYARNKHVGWAAMWTAFGFFFPLFTTGVAVVQGIGKSKSG